MDVVSGIWEAVSHIKTCSWTEHQNLFLDGSKQNYYTTLNYINAAAQSTLKHIQLHSTFIYIQHVSFFRSPSPPVLSLSLLPPSDSPRGRNAGHRWEATNKLRRTPRASANLCPRVSWSFARFCRARWKGRSGRLRLNDVFNSETSLDSGCLRTWREKRDIWMIA